MCRTVFALGLNGLGLLWLVHRSRWALAAENVFLREQLALFRERQTRLGLANDATRVPLVLLVYLFAWKNAPVLPKNNGRPHAASFSSAHS